MSNVNQIDSEDEGLEFGYSADEAEPTANPDPESQENTDSESAEPAEQQVAEPAPDTKPEGQEEEAPGPGDSPASAGDDSPAYKKLEGRLRNMQGEINKLTKQLTARESAAAAAAAIEQGADAPTDSQVKAAMRNGAKLEELRKEFPEWAEALDEQASSIEERVLSKIAAPDTALATKDEMAQFKRTLPILIKHPTFEDDVKTPEFSAWLNAQADDVKSLADSEKPGDAIALLDKFHARAKAPPKSNQQRLQRSVIPSTGANGQTTRAMTEDDAMAVGYRSV